MKVLTYILPLALIFSCSSTNEKDISDQNNLKLFEFSPPVVESFRNYYREVQKEKLPDSIGYALYIDYVSPDSSVYYFHVYEAANWFERNLVIGLGKIDSVPVIVSMRSDLLALNYEEVNQKYHDQIKSYVPLEKGMTTIYDLPCYKSTYYKNDSVKNELTWSSPFFLVKPPVTE
jgi:hypothetical protein